MNSSLPAQTLQHGGDVLKDLIRKAFKLKKYHFVKRLVLYDGGVIEKLDMVCHSNVICDNPHDRNSIPDSHSGR